MLALSLQRKGQDQGKPLRRTQVGHCSLQKGITMQLVKSFTIIASLALALSACSANGTSSTSDVQLDTVGAATQSDALCGNTFWGWLTGSGCSDDAPNQNLRPSDRPQVVCSWWCPTGYTRRDVTIGPSCSWYHIGKCVDSNSYEGESCGFAGKVCMGTTSCQDATPEDTVQNAHPQACY